LPEGHCLGNIREVNFFILPPPNNNIFYLTGLLLLHHESAEIKRFLKH